MYKLCVFAGTTEGRKLVEFLSRQVVQVTACVATEYGESLLEPSDNLTVSARRLSPEQIEAMLRENGFDMVVDSTHPYAENVTESISYACRETGTRYLRLLRDESAFAEDAVYVEDVAAAVEYLNTVEGNILLTTGSKELDKYVRIRDFTQRVYVRVLPMHDSLELCRAVGVKPSHIIAMQGPFSEELNTAMLRSVSASYMVTKDGGSPGGFGEKASAARKAGAKLVVIGRPPQKAGLTLPQTVELLCQQFDLMRSPHVTVVGIGPGARRTMTKEVMDAIDGADCLIGAERMLEAVSSGGQKTVSAIAPSDIAEYILSHGEHRSIVVVMSGDSGFFSGTKKLLPLLGKCSVNVLPGISSLVYLCSKLQIDYEDVVTVSLHGRDRDIVGDIRANPHTFVLVGGENGIGALCDRLTESGLGHVKMSVGERLSYPNEKITVGTAQALLDRRYEPLSVALIENERCESVVTTGLPDELFLRGQGAQGVVPMTKSEVRAVCLSKLCLTVKSVCWDVGAGTGSVAIEMARQAIRGHVYAIERREEAVSLMEKNCRELSVSNLTVVSGTAPNVCCDLPAPTHVFVGGSGGNMKRILETVLEKNPNVRIVATAISLESIAELTDCIKIFSFNRHEVISLSVAKNRVVGSYHLMTGQNPIYIFTMQKTEDAE